MLCSPPPATTLASSCAGSEGFCAPCCRRSSQRSRIHNRPKTGRTLLLHERLITRVLGDDGADGGEKASLARACRHIHPVHALVVGFPGDCDGALDDRCWLIEQ